MPGIHGRAASKPERAVRGRGHRRPGPHQVRPGVLVPGVGGDFYDFFMEGEAPQFDDITMLTLRYNGSEPGES